MIKLSFGIFLFCMVLFDISCNNANNETANNATQITSEESLINAISKYPDSLALIQNLIELYRDKGYYDSALLLTNNQIRKDSGNAFLWNMKATLLFENEDTLNAIKSLQNAINIYPLPEYLVALGTIYAELKDSESLIIADELLKANRVKSGKDAMFIKGLYYSYSDEKRKAINYFDSSLKLDFTYMFSYREKAIALYDLKRYDEAIEVLKRAVTLQNNFDEGYYWMGKCYERLSRKKDAIQSYQTALLYDKNFIEAREALEKIQGKGANSQ